MESAETLWDPIGSGNHTNGKLQRNLCHLYKHYFPVP